MQEPHREEQVAKSLSNPTGCGRESRPVCPMYFKLAQDFLKLQYELATVNYKLKEAREALEDLKKRIPKKAW